MNKTQFLILNALAILFLLLTGTRFLLFKDLETTRNRFLQSQNIVSQGQQSEKVLRQIILRLAQASQREPDLRDLLKQFNVKVTNNPTPPAPVAPTPAAPVPAKSKP